MAVTPFRVLIMGILLLVLGCSEESLDTRNLDEGGISIPELESQLLVSVNSYRESIGLNGLETSTLAYDDASSHTDYMISVGAINHDNFDKRASKIASKTSAKKIGENVAKNHRTIELALDNWLGSPSHKATIEGDYSHTAISIKKDSIGTIYYTQIFISQ